MARTRCPSPKAAVLAAALWPLGAGGHFLELIPGHSLLDSGTGNRLSLALTFTHPASGGPAMAMDRPVRFGVVAPQGRRDLLATLQPATVDGQRAWRADYQVRSPGDHVFFVEPSPYWEPAEGRLILHYTKVVVDGFGGSAGWEAPVGLPVEIRPLTRPYGLWTGNVFRGVVTRNAEPVPHARVEVAWHNDGSLPPPPEAFQVQELRADGQGVFAYGIPRSGWWGFAALLEADRPVAGPAGEPVPVELGGLIWVHARDMGTAAPN